MTKIRNDRHDLWASQTEILLHATDHCCGGATMERYPRRKVRDHYDPSYFYDDKFRLCAVALSDSTPPTTGDG